MELGRRGWNEADSRQPERVFWLTRWAVMVAGLGLGMLSSVQAEDDSSGSGSASEVARELANPNTSLGFFAFPVDYISFQGDLPGSGDQEALRISAQPSLPYPLGKNTNFFLRPLIPIIIKQPVFNGSDFDDSDTELGDIGFDMAIGTGFANGVQLIGGLAGTLDTATNNDVGRGQTLLGPEAFLGQKTSWGFYGLLVTHQWDVAGDDDFDTSITAGQYFFTYDLQDAWQIQMQPTWSYDHEADSDDAWTLPVGIGVSKTIIAGKTPLKFSLQYWHYIETPDTFGPDYQVRFQIAPVVPLPW